jgi:RimJ/RimL family protein N-acetyltransferase
LIIEEKIIMASIRLLDKNPIIINFIINELLKPEVHQLLFDDICGLNEIAIVLFDPRTIIYGIYMEGRPEPAGVIYFSNTIPYRSANLSAALFPVIYMKKEKTEKGIVKVPQAENIRNKGIISSIAEKVKEDFFMQYKVRSVFSGVIGENPISEHLLIKLGFTLVGTKKDGVSSGGKYQDQKVYQYINKKNQEMEDENG